MIPEGLRGWLVPLLMLLVGLLLFMAVDEPAPEIIYADDRLGSIEELLPSQEYVRKVTPLGNGWYLVTIEDTHQHRVPTTTILMVVKYPLPTSNMPPQISITSVD